MHPHAFRQRYLFDGAGGGQRGAAYACVAWCVVWHMLPAREGRGAEPEAYLLEAPLYTGIKCYTIRLLIK